ncbi:MAG: hypothetical protein JNL72_15400 [Flavipsychrobacter sp.]|nr:hypothetical protein [Flavipsychrobacter sp.]
MKKITLVACLLYCHSAFAQKNTIEIGVGAYRLFGVIDQGMGVLQTASIKYKRAINSRLGVYLGYTRLPVNGYNLSQERIGFAFESTGKLTSRKHYNYFDLGVQYTVLTMGRHSLSAIGSASLACGTNEYLVKTNLPPQQPGTFAEITYAETELKKESYPGGMLTARYDCKLWKNRLNLGAELAARYYTHNFPFQLNYGLHVGYSF